MRSFFHFSDSSHRFCRYCGLLYAEVGLVWPASQNEASTNGRGQGIEMNE